MTCGIYCYIDKNDNKIVYIGKDSYIDKNTRHKQHYNSCNYNDQPINRILQNNPNRYTYQVLTWNVTDKDTLNTLETSYITHLNPKFNFTSGGDSGIPSTEVKMNISKFFNNTGFYRVSKVNDKTYSQGFKWRYRYRKGTTRIDYCSFDLFKLEEKVKKHGLTWNMIDEEKAQKTVEFIENQN